MPKYASRNTEEIKKAFAKNLNSFIASTKMNLSQFSRCVGISQPEMFNFSKGNKVPVYADLQRLYNYGMSANLIFNGECGEAPELKLKCVYFHSNELLCDFVNSNNVCKDDILSVTKEKDCIALLYWG